MEVLVVLYPGRVSVTVDLHSLTGPIGLQDPGDVYVAVIVDVFPDPGTVIVEVTPDPGTVRVEVLPDPVMVTVFALPVTYTVDPDTVFVVS